MIDVDRDHVTWSISSSDGRRHISCRMARRSASSSQTTTTSTGAFVIEGQAWQRDRPLKNAALTRDFRIELPQVVVRLDALRRLRERLVEWQVNPAGFTCELCDPAADQRLSVSIGRDERLVTDLFKPAAIVDYENGPSMRGRWAFLVDPSGLRHGAESLGDVLRAGSGVRTCR